jgi:2-polyprenyl-3-methyl-5-hydroxy-6-metoxy-1,4-benzoquinol methylase
VGSADARAFYDEYIGRQTEVGINARHRSIMRWLRRFGLRPDDRVLEIGCGVGTLTQLLAEALGPKGSVVAVDFSSRSIEAARERLVGFNHVKLVVGDVADVELDGRFDAIVLPDVIEHIPLAQHSRLFERVASWVRPDGFVALHDPNPHHLEWCREHRPEVLQVIDQPIHADVLVGNAYPHGLYLDFLETYSIWVREGDYVVAMMRPRAGTRTFTQLPPPRRSLLTRIRGRIRRLIDERRS